MLIVKSLLSTICVVIAITGLLTEKLTKKKYVILLIWIFIISCISQGHRLGILAVIGSLIFLWFMVRECKFLNLCLASLGYLLCVLCNNAILFLISFIFGTDINKLASNYYVVFSVGYAFLLFWILKGINSILIPKMRSKKNDIYMKKSFFGILLNLLIYIVIFILNITMGNRIGYKTEVLLFNSILFGLCMISSSIILFNVIKKIEREEEINREKERFEMLRQYTTSVEYMLDDMRAFRHDYKNILVSMAGYLRENDIGGLREYFKQNIQDSVVDIEEKNNVWISLKHINPMGLKGFLYEKVLLALSENVEISVEIREDVTIECSYMNDLIRALGIFIDNAIEEVNDEKKGRVLIRIEKKDGILFWIENTCTKELDLSQIFEKGYSDKGEGRGSGLSWVKNMIEKHNDLYHECRISDGKVIQILEIM